MMKKVAFWSALTVLLLPIAVLVREKDQSAPSGQEVNLGFSPAAIDASAQSPVKGKNLVPIRGQKQEVYYYPAAGAKLNRKILFVPGDGGWRGYAITLAETMASWGYDVYGWTPTYLESFTTGRSHLDETDVMSDFRQTAGWMTHASGENSTAV